MSFSTLVSSIVRGWYIIVACALLATLAALVANWTAKPNYTATSVVFLTSPGEGGQASLAAAAPTLAQLATLSTVLEPSAQKLSYTGGAKALKEKVESTNPTGTSFINVDATDSDPARSATVSREVAQQLMNYVNTSPQTRKQVQATMVEPAPEPTRPSSTPRAKLLVTGLIGGLGIGLVIALVLGSLRRSREADRGTAVATQTPIRTTAAPEAPRTTAATAPSSATAPRTAERTRDDAPTTVIPTVRDDRAPASEPSSTKATGASQDDRSSRGWLGRSR